MFSFLDGDQLRQSGMVLQALASHAACWRENKGCKSSLFDIQDPPRVRALIIIIMI